MVYSLVISSCATKASPGGGWKRVFSNSDDTMRSRCGAIYKCRHLLTYLLKVFVDQSQKYLTNLLTPTSDIPSTTSFKIHLKAYSFRVAYMC